MDHKITLRTKTTAADFKALTFFNLFRKKRLMPVFLIFGALLSLAAIIGRLGGFVPMSDWYFYVCIAFLGLLLLQYLIFEFSVKKFLASDKLVTENERTVAIDEEGIEVEGGKENSAGVYRWDMLYHAYETKKYYYLYINTAQAIILPKRDFGNGEIPTVEKLIRQKLGKRYYKR